MDFDSGGLIFGESNLDSELHSLAEFIGNVLLINQLFDKRAIYADTSLDDWKKHLGQLRVKFPSLRFKHCFLFKIINLM